MAPLTRARLILIGLLLAAGAAAAAVVHDPWLARLQVGEFRDPGDIALDPAGWPRGLLAPLTVDPGWQLGARDYFASPDLPRRPDQVAWRLALPALGSAGAAAAAYGDARTQALALLALADTAAAAPSQAMPTRGPWAFDGLRLAASRTWQAGDWAAAAAACGAILDGAGECEPSERLVWRLRQLALRSRAGLPDDVDGLWPLLADLGPFDTRSGWALWLALRRARGLAPLPPGEADRDAAVLVAAAGQLFLTADEFYGLGLPDDATAGLGAQLLPRADLDRHFARFPTVPRDGRFQGAWLLGQRRRDGSAAAIERLAVLPDLEDGHRLDLWRRASEARLLRTDWEAGLTDLTQALQLMDSRASRAMRGRLREWTVQALALALAEQRAGDAASIVALADGHLPADDLLAFRLDAAALLARLDLGGPVDAAGLRERGEALVREGRAPDLGSRPRLVLPDPAAWRDRLWTVWAAWGLALCDGAGPLTPAQRDYQAGLRFVRDHDDPSQRHTSACALAAERLQGTGAVGALLDYAWHRDLEAASGGRALPRPTPMPDLLEPAPWTGLDVQLRGHALLGLAIALGDDRGLVAAAVRLPAAGLPDRDYRLFWYPVPADPAVRRALAATDLPPELLLAIARNESLFEPAIRSRAGALGYMQIMPFHYDEPASAAGDRHWSHPATSLNAAARILGGESRRFGGDPYRTVAAYNAGSGAVTRWQKQLRGVADRDLFWAWIGYPETRGYTLRVLRDREVYRWLLDPDR
ncbi:MAG: lytic transglycosylase domain-containing protein [Candidatus Krumholzibacteriia bacterium]